jgi:hypothetical protein
MTIRIRDDYDTREDAVAFCREYVRRVNCNTGEFTDFRGTRYKFLGPNRTIGNLLW